MKVRVCGGVHAVLLVSIAVGVLLYMAGYAGEPCRDPDSDYVIDGNAVIVDFDDVNAVASDMTFHPRTWQDKGVIFHTVDAGDVGMVGEEIDLTRLTDKRGDPLGVSVGFRPDTSNSVPNMAFPASDSGGRDTNDVLMTFVSPVSSAGTFIDGVAKPKLQIDRVRLLALEHTGGDQYRVIDADELCDDEKFAPMAVSSERPFSHALFQLTSEREGFDNVHFTQVPIQKDCWDLREDFQEDEFPPQWRYRRAKVRENLPEEIEDLVPAGLLRRCRWGDRLIRPTLGSWVDPDAINDDREYGSWLVLNVRQPGVASFDVEGKQICESVDRPNPSGTVFVHPSVNAVGLECSEDDEVPEDVIIDWQSPRDGGVTVTGFVRNVYPCESCDARVSDGMRWTIQKIGFEGEISAQWTGLTTRRDTREDFYLSIGVRVGELLRFRCSPRRTEDCDHGEISAQICYQDAFVRGDANADGSRDVSDAIFMLNYLFGGAFKAEPKCLEALDANDDGILDDPPNVADPIYLLNFLFGGGPPPPAPHIECGIDMQAGLGCESFPPCE